MDIGEKAKRKMAVPFRAEKLIPLERTEFGQVDVAILLTLLSYYYYGLTDEQIDSAFACSTRDFHPAEEYNKWICAVRYSRTGLLIIKYDLHS